MPRLPRCGVKPYRISNKTRKPNGFMIPNSDCLCTGVFLPNGTGEELEKDIIEKISILGKDGGYMIAPAHILQNDVSPDRVLKFIELCKKHGSYN